MTEHRDRLTTSLAERHAIERDIGAGGMGIVHLTLEPQQ